MLTLPNTPVARAAIFGASRQPETIDVARERAPIMGGTTGVGTGGSSRGRSVSGVWSARPGSFWETPRTAPLRSLRPTARNVAGYSDGLAVGPGLGGSKFRSRNALASQCSAAATGLPVSPGKSPGGDMPAAPSSPIIAAAADEAGDSGTAVCPPGAFLRGCSPAWDRSAAVWAWPSRAVEDRVPLATLPDFATAELSAGPDRGPWLIITARISL